MLVSLGTNVAVAANASVTLAYACRSVEKVFIKMDDPTGSTAYDHRISIQLGSRTICNGADALGLIGFQYLQSQGVASGSEYTYQIDLGSHTLLDNENLYVTVIGGSASLDAVDVSAIVDEPVQNFPIRYTQYADNVFTAENVLKAISWDTAGQLVDEDNYNIEIRTNVNSSSPNLISCSNWFSATAFAGQGYYGRLVDSPIPLTTTFNYNSAAVTDKILVASQMGSSDRARQASQNQTKMAVSQVGK